MLTTHIDVEVFVDAIMAERKKSSKILREFKEYLLSGSNQTFYGVNRTTPLDYINLLSTVLEGRGENSKSTFKPKSIVFDESIFDAENPYQVFLLKNSNRNKQKVVSEKLKHIVGFITNYIQVFKHLIYEPFFRVDEKTSKNKFENWIQILPDLPVTDAIVSDPYLFVNNKNAPLENNYFRLLKSIKEKYPQLSRLLIFTSYIERSEFENIIKKSNEILGTTIFRIIFFQNESEHDRHIFLNYSHIRVGSSLNFLFDKDQKLSVKKKSTITIESYSNPKNLEMAKTILSFLYDELKQLQKEKKVSQNIHNNLFNFKQG